MLCHYNPPVNMTGTTALLGQKISHYEIVDEIGAGGMGVVYRARDTLLQRFVAIKALPPSEAADSNRERRFLVEACAASALSHPNIITVHDIVSANGSDFIVMEYVDGKPLNEFILKTGLPFREALSYGVQIADALAAAHAASIAHRDLKPANILVRPDGSIKILDFGLAKFYAAGEVGVDDVTMATPESEVGAIMGTVEYMAPEQILGEAVDGRSDIFSFGCVLYQMFTGQGPFARLKHPVKILHEIAYGKPEAPRKLRPDIPEIIEQIILKALSKRPRDRYQSAAEMKELLEELRIELDSGGTVTTKLVAKVVEDLQSIAVLPLANLSGDPAHEFFADGMTEALIADLAKIRALRVVTRTSVMQYKGVHRPISEIASELGVGVVLEGSFARSGSRVRITAQLIESATEKHLWVESYDREAADVLGIQSEVAQAIAKEVRVQLTPQEEEHFARNRKVDPEAHEAYLKGRFHWNQRTFEALQRGVEFFNRAIELDPAYALAYVGLADSYNLLGYYNERPPKETYPLAIAAASKALEVDERLGEAHASLGYSQCFYNWDWAETETRFDRALELNPTYASTHQWHGWLFIAQQRLGHAITAMQRAHELDPLSLIINDHLGLAMSLTGLHDQAITQLEKTIELNPNYPLVYQRLGSVHLRRGAAEDAIGYFQKAADLSQGRIGLGRLGLAMTAAGRECSAQEVLERLIKMSESRFVSALDVAFIQAGLGEIDRAFVSLRRAVKERISDLIRFDLHPWPDAMREDPRFAETRDSIGLPEPAFHSGK